MDNDNPRAKELDKVRRELQRKSLDQLRVYNPTDKDYAVIWDGFNHIVPSKQERTLPRYIATKYFKEMINQIIYDEEEKAIAEANSKRLERGNPPLTAQERETYALQYGLHTANEDKRREIMKVLYKGVAEEYGVDMPLEGKPVKKDERTTDEKLLAELEKDLPEPEEKEEHEDIEAKKVELLKKTKGNGQTNKKKAT